jgi:hypothetical protein
MEEWPTPLEWSALVYTAASQRIYLRVKDFSQEVWTDSATSFQLGMHAQCASLGTACRPFAFFADVAAHTLT